MKRGRRSLNDQGDSSNGERSGLGNPGQKLIKSTYMLDSVLKEHLAFVAWAKNEDQSDIVREALRKHLSKMGCDLSRPPDRPQFR